MTSSPVRSPHNAFPTPVRTVLRANSASNLHRIGNGTRGPGVEAGFRGEKSSVLRLSCASIRFLVDDGDRFFDCVCVVLYRCVCHLSFLLLLLDLRCKAIAPRVAEKRCYCSLLTFFSLRLCSLMVALSLFLFLKFDGLSGPLFFASQFIVHSFRLNHHICCNMQLFLLFLTQSTRWK